MPCRPSLFQFLRYPDLEAEKSLSAILFLILGLVQAAFVSQSHVYNVKLVPSLSVRCSLLESFILPLDAGLLKKSFFFLFLPQVKSHLIDLLLTVQRVSSPLGLPWF